MVEKDDTITEIVKFSWNSLFMKFLDIRSNMFKKHSDKKGNFVEESFAAELNVIWIPAHFWNTDSDNAETYFYSNLFSFILILLNMMHMGYESQFIFKYTSNFQTDALPVIACHSSSIVRPQLFEYSELVGLNRSIGFLSFHLAPWENRTVTDCELSCRTSIELVADPAWLWDSQILGTELELGQASKQT